MSNDELRGMANNLARILVTTDVIPAQLLRKAQRLYHALEMETSATPHKKMRTSRRKEKEYGNETFPQRRRNRITA